MNRLVWPAALLCALAQVAAADVEGILSALGKEEAAAVVELRKLHAAHGAKGIGFKRKHLGAAMSRGMWDLAGVLLEVASEAGVNLESDFQMEQSRVNSRVSKLKAQLKRPARHGRPIMPTTKWAQSATDIHLWVKFAHKLDTPAMTDIKAGAARFGPTTLSFNASNAQKRFTLDMLLLREIDPDASTGCTMGSAGTCTFVLRKKVVNATWPRLLKSRDKPKNMHVWFSMKEQHAAGLEEGQRWIDDAPNRARREKEEAERVERERKQQAEEAEKNKTAAADAAAGAAAPGGDGAAAGAGAAGGAAGGTPLSTAEKEEL
eukprot:g8147.t1